MTLARPGQIGHAVTLLAFVRASARDPVPPQRAMLACLLVLEVEAKARQVADRGQIETA